ncbi:MAG TPA: SLBB domain-containing protein, partial [Gemmatimonadota bacterium]|nr:SLBB domain-containing protein [Gemmatimonadota bacterium]
MRDPQVSVFVEEIVASTVTVQGAVLRPGVYELVGRKTLLEILGEAGGLMGRENERAGGTIKVLRGSAEDEVVEVDLERLLSGQTPTLDLTMRPGDIVLVPHALRNRVYVTGAVKRPAPRALRREARHPLGRRHPSDRRADRPRDRASPYPRLGAPARRSRPPLPGPARR